MWAILLYYLILVMFFETDEIPAVSIWTQFQSRLVHFPKETKGLSITVAHFSNTVYASGGAFAEKSV